MTDFFNALWDAVVLFFTSLPDAGEALWQFMNGWYGLAITVASAVLIAGLTYLALILRDAHGWLSAMFGMMAATIAAWWAFGIIPSAWIYFLDSQQDLLRGRIIPGAIDPIWSNFYQFFRDSVVMVETIIAMGGFAVLALAIQKRYPRSLAEGEEPRPQSGGYK